MKDEKSTIFTPELTVDPEELLPCPMCGGRVVLRSSRWTASPYDPHTCVWECEKCRGKFEYSWFTSAYEHIPTPVEWWNKRAPAHPRRLEGYDVEQLRAVIELPQEHGVDPNALDRLSWNMADCVKIAEHKFLKDLEKMVSDMVANLPTTPKIQTKEERIWT